MSGYTKLNLRRDVEDMAPRFGLVLSGGARFKVDEELVDLGPLEVPHVPGAIPRGMEAGPEGVELVVFGAPNTGNRDTEMVPEFWPPRRVGFAP